MRFCYDTISRPCKICRRFIWKREASKERRSSKGEETMMSRVAARRLSSLSSAAWTPARAASSHWNPMERSDSSPSKDLRSGSFSSFFFSRPESHLPRRGLFSVLFCNSRLIFRVPSSWNHRVLPYLGFSVAHGLYLWKWFFVFFNWNYHLSLRGRESDFRWIWIFVLLLLMGLHVYHPIDV